MLQPNLEDLCVALKHARDLAPLPPPPTVPATNPAATSRHIRSISSPKDRPIDLAVTTIRSCMLPNTVTDFQSAAIRKMRSWLDDNDVRSCHPAHMKHLIELFSQVFFLKDLEPGMILFARMKIPIVDKKFRRLGLCGHIGGGRVAIVIDPQHNWCLNKRTSILSTLFHESIHAYFQLFCCDHHRQTGCTHRNLPLWKPGSAHDIAFFHLAAGVELALSRYLNLDVDLSVFRSLINEYIEVNAPRYPPGEWTRFFELYKWDGVDSLIRKLQVSEFLLLAQLLKTDDQLQNGLLTSVFWSEYLKAQDNGHLKAQQKHPMARLRGILGDKDRKDTRIDHGRIRLYIQGSILRIWLKIVHGEVPKRRGYSIIGQKRAKQKPRGRI